MPHAKSLRGRKACLLEVDPHGAQPLRELVVLAGAELLFETEPGGCYMLYPAGSAPTPDDLAPASFMRRAKERCFFGVKCYPRF